MILRKKVTKVVRAVCLNVALCNSATGLERSGYLVVEHSAIRDKNEGPVALNLSEHFLGEEDHGDALPTPLSVPENAEPTLDILLGWILMLTRVVECFDGIVDAQVLVVLGDDLVQSTLTSIKSVNFSTRSRRRDFSHVPRIIVSRLTRPGFSSFEIRFHSPKCSHPAVMEPTLHSLPFERITRSVYQNSWGSGLCSHSDCRCTRFQGGGVMP